MKKLFIVTGLVIVLAYVMTQWPKEDFGVSSFETTVSGVGETDFNFHTGSSYLYGLFISFNKESLPANVREGFWNSREQLDTNWEATLILRTNGGLCVSTNFIHLTPARMSGERMYFAIENGDFLRAKSIQVSLSPHQPSPFDAPSIAVMPVDIGLEWRDVDNLVRKGWCLVAAGIVILVVFGTIKVRTSADSPHRAEK